jgi:hypothetical protein
VDEPSIRKAMHYGSVVASFGVEAFSLDRLARLRGIEIQKRMKQFNAMLASGR